MAYAIDTSDRRRRRALRAATPLAALLVAALLIWQGSNAAFSASTSNTDDTWETGNLLLTNNGGVGSTYSATTTALFNELNLKPGDTGVKCITVESTGSLAGDLRLYRGTISGANNFNALAGWIDLTVDAQTVLPTTHVAADCAGYTGGTGGAVFNNTLASMPMAYATATGTAVAGGPQHIVYRIGWTINANADNTVQSSSAIADLTWEIN
jgi:hypothetical protein